MPVLCWIWQKQYTCSRFNSVGVFQETDTGDTGSLMSEWISITMRCGAFSMWDFLTTTLTVFHIITHCKAWTQTNQHCLRFIMRRHPLWSKYVTRDGNIMLINKGHLQRATMARAICHQKHFTAEGQYSRWGSFLEIYMCHLSRWKSPLVETATCKSSHCHLISAFIITAS